LPILAATYNGDGSAGSDEDVSSVIEGKVLESALDNKLNNGEERQ
jgi:hypothetical protein